MSSEGRRRVALRTLKTIGAAVSLAFVGWGAVQIVIALQGDPKRLASPGQTPAIREVVLVTDGVLDHNWIVDALALPKGATLMDVDLFQLRNRLMSFGQVHSAMLTRNFPATLHVKLSERSPVARVMAQIGSEPPHPYLIARDGVVFDGVGYDSHLLESLPWLDGVKLTKSDGEFLPVERMDVVADLLGKAKLEAEHLYRTWQIVSMERLETDGELLVKSADIATIRFSVTEDFFRQLARLDTLLDTARARTDQPLREVNLAIGAQVPAAFDDPALSPGKPAPKNTRPASAAPLPLFPPPSRKT